ncbi:MAG: 3-hydroxyacyl-CoA dehydrogenase family protein [Desulfofustis sp.]
MYTLARVGCHSKIFARTAESVERGMAAFKSLLDVLKSEDLIGSDQVAAAQELVSGTTELESAVADADLVIESIPENLQLKQDFFGRIEQNCRRETLLASNTSGLPATELAAFLEQPERFAVTHFWNPPHLMPLVEVVKGKNTSMATVEMLVDLFSRAGKKPVLVLKDTPGQLGNRLFQALLREAIHIVEEGIASVEDVDTAVKNGLGRRFPVYGPLEHNDVVGLDTLHAIQSYICASLCSDTEPAELLKEKYAAGDHGVKSGKGFYDWRRRSSRELIDERDRFLLQLMKLERAGQS